MGKIGIYIIKNKINNHSYVGMSKDIPLRWRHHINESQNQNSKEYEKTLYRAFRKYGLQNFSFEILEYCEEEQLREREIYWINKLDTLNNGYNELNSWQPEIKLDGENHPNHKLTLKDVIDIRTRYANKERRKDVEQLYKNKIGSSGFSKIWKGETWKNIMPEVFNNENKNFHLHNTRQKGTQNGRSKFTEEQVYDIRMRKKNGENRQNVYEDYKHLCSSKYFQEIWYGYKWKDIIVE